MKGTPDPFSILSQALRERSAPIVPKDCHPLYRRLGNALRGADLGVPDFCGLVYHLLRREELLQGREVEIAVSGQWPTPRTPAEWRARSFLATQRDPKSWFVMARPWSPEWAGGEIELLGDIFRESRRRTDVAVPGDPFLRLMGPEFTNYKSVAQREAVRAVLLAKPGSTLVLNLPTGAGKSLCSLLPALMGTHDCGTAVVVVPTVSLALDQEKNLRGRDGLNHDTAYYGDQTDEGLDRNRGIRRRIRDGLQRVVFASPESLAGSLARHIHETAQQGLLRMLVIDEAHTVDSWGESFRPAFQELAGLRRLWMDATPAGAERPVTVLQSATLTDPCLATLKKLFGDPGPFEAISAVQVRPEPSYWVCPCETRDLKVARLREALRFLPRPVIVYTSTREEADDVNSALRDEGYRRIAKMTGDTDTGLREEIVSRWRARDLDIMVATSAFGLGVDMPETRAVVHACVPESVDRYYQEVGRGGRDGSASVSITFFCAEDFKVARNLNQQHVITPEVGRLRWQAMFAGAKHVAPDLVEVNLDTAPPDNPQMLQRGRFEWNQGTLTLMARGDMIRFEALPPLARVVDDRAPSVDDRHLRLVRVLVPGHQEESTWKGLVELERNRSKWFARRSLKLMFELLRGNRCASHVFSEAYRVPFDGPPIDNVAVRPMGSCGGCARCRRDDTDAFEGVLPEPGRLSTHMESKVGELLSVASAHRPVLLVEYDAGGGTWQPRVLESTERLLKWCVGQNIQNIILPRDMVTDISRILAGSSAPAFIYDEARPRSLYPLATFAVVNDHPTLLGQIDFLVGRRSIPLLVLVAPRGTSIPSHPERTLAETWNCRAVSLDMICRELAI